MRTHEVHLQDDLSLEDVSVNKKSGATLLADFLISQNVDHIFGYPGGAILPFYDALYQVREKLQHILVRHEQASVHAAQGYARVTDKCGVCVATSGPGATNLLTGIADAFRDSTPIVCITGQVPKQSLGTAAFQEVDIVAMAKPVAKRAVQITEIKDLIPELILAFKTALEGRPGPVLVDITKNVLLDELSLSELADDNDKLIQPSGLDAATCEALETAAALINAAEKPLLLIGQGVILSGAQSEVVALAEKADIPTASTLLGLSAFPSEHHLFVGMLGMHGNVASNVKTNECDVLIAIGMRFDERVTGNLAKYAKQAKIIHIDIDACELGTKVKPVVPVVSDAGMALRYLLPLVTYNRHNNWKAEFEVCNRVEFSEVVKNDLFPRKEELNMAEVIRELSQQADNDVILVTDVGQHQMVAARYFQFKSGGQNVTTGGLGTMGFAVPAAMGAKIAKPKNQVVVVVGDGGFMMNIQELATIAALKIDIKIVVLNNEYLGMVRQWQDIFFDERQSEVHLENPDLAKVTNAFNVKASRVEDRKELTGAIRELLSSTGPCLLEVMVEKQANVFPMFKPNGAVDDLKLS